MSVKLLAASSYICSPTQLMQAIYAKREDGTPQLLRRSAQMKLHAAALVAVMTCPNTPPELGPALPRLLPAAMHLLLSLKAHEVGPLPTACISHQLGLRHGQFLSSWSSCNAPDVLPASCWAYAKL